MSDIPKNVLCEECKSIGRSLFSGLNRQEREELSANKSCRIIRKREILFREGSPPQGVYCLNRGKVKISKLGEEGRDQIVRLARPGDLLGYRTMISGGTYNATATALEDCLVCHIPHQTFMEMLDEKPPLSMKLLKRFSEDLGKAENKLTDFTQKPIDERLAEALIMLYDIYGMDDDKVLNVSLTREEMANIIGTTTETAIRYLSSFKKKGLIDLKGRKIVIKNYSALESIATV